MDSIVDKKFNEWTSGLSEVEARISIFEHIRDIPYFVYPQLWDIKTGPAMMLEIYKGSCTPKHYLLGEMFEKLDLNVRYCTFPFNWKEFDIRYPSKLEELAAKMPVAYHHACRVLINGKWVLVDATWDKSLAPSGFPVNRDWDGKRDTLLAVKAKEEICFDNDGKRDKDVKERLAEYDLSDKLALSRFSAQLNEWLESLRRK